MALLFTGTDDPPYNPLKNRRGMCAVTLSYRLEYYSEP